MFRICPQSQIKKRNFNTIHLKINEPLIPLYIHHTKIG